MRERLKQILLLSISVFFLFGAGVLFAKQDKVLEIKGLKKVGKDLKTEFKSQVSQKNLLGLKRKSKFSLPSIDKSNAQVETLKILGIRVEFQEEVPDNSRTTGNGLFDRRSYQQHYEQESHIIDPSPHYRQYFLAHLKALNNYWYIVSNGKVILDTLGSEVYPLEESLTYRLPHTISYYGSPDSAGYPYDGLGKFFHDSFNLADSLSPEIDFSAYDAFIIFHSGSDKQSDIGSFSPTYSPDDLYTGFIIHETPVSVDNDSFAFNEAIIMPETRSQDTRISALNSVMAHEFGHQLGLLDFYNTKTFTTQIGNFSLMDNNAQDFGIELDSCRTPVTGLIPVYPDAWSMAYLGFNQPEEILNQNNIKLYASEMLRADSIQSVKIPVNSEEYFLIENRQTDVDGESISLLADSGTGVVLGPVTPDKNFNREYDVLLPGSGILIWHIDEGVAYLDYDGDGFTNFEDNALQWDKDRRFITLEEADGYIDFGGDYYTGFGLQEDMYYLGNNSNFTPDTYPSSRSNNRSETHIYVTGIGKSDTVMTFNVKNDIILAGWPQRILADSGNSSMVYGDLDGDGKDEVLTASSRFVYAWRLDGSKYIPNSDAVQVEGLDGEYTLYPLAIFAEAETTIFGTPSLGDLNRDNSLEVVSGDINGKLYIWEATDNNNDGRADLFLPIQVGNKTTMTPVIADLVSTFQGPEVFAGAEDGKWVLISFGDSVILIGTGDYVESVVGLTTTDLDSINFILTESDQLGHLRRVTINWIEDWIKEIPSTGNFVPVVGDINRDDKLEVIVLSGSGEIYAWDIKGNVLNGFPVYAGDIYSAPALGDIDGDGYLEIIFCGDNKLYAYNYNGTPATNFPVIIERVESTGSITSAPILADLNGDGKTEIIFGSKDNRIFALQGDGYRFNLFPLTLDGEVITSGIVLNDSVSKSGDNVNYVKRDIFFKSKDGLVYGYTLDFSAYSWEEKTPWLMYGYNSGHTNSLPKTLLPEVPIYAELMPEKAIYNYPNPANDETTIRYFLSRDAAVSIKFFDISGDLVAEANQTGKANTENEFKWDCSGYASGVYLCRVEAKSGYGKQVGFCKIALVK